MEKYWLRTRKAFFDAVDAGWPIKRGGGGAFCSYCFSLVGLERRRWVKSVAHNPERAGSVRKHSSYLAVFLGCFGVLLPNKCITFQFHDNCHATSRLCLHMKVFLTHRMNALWL